MPRVFVPGKPIPQGSKRYFGTSAGGKTRVGESSPGVAPWRDRIAGEVHRVWEREPVRGPVHVKIRFLFNRPKNQLRGDGSTKASAPRLPSVRPDLDKLVRAVLDSLSGVVFVDDSQVSLLNCGKEYTNGPAGAEISWDVLG